jgi:hypothetical protein
MSFLFSIPPRGLGTVDVECLSSYLYRLADAHGVTVYQLHHVLEDWWDSLPQRESLPAYPRHCTSSALNGFGRDVTSLVRVLERATGQRGMAQLTLYALHDVSGNPCTGGLSSLAMYCAACMQEWLSKDEPLYYKLAWNMLYVDRCPIHQLALVTSCFYCGHFRLNEIFEDGDVCRGCGRNPYENYKRWSHATRPGLGEKDVLDVIEYSAANPGYIYPKDAPWIFFEARQHFEFDREFKGKIGAVFHRNGYQTVRPRVSSLIRMSAYFGVPLIEILTEPIASAGKWPLPIAAPELPPLARREEIDPLTRARLAAALRAKLKIESITPTAKEICLSVGVSHGFGNYWCLPLMEAVRRQRKRLIRERAQKEREESRRIVDLEILHAAERLCGSRRHAIAAIANATKLPVYLIRHRVKELTIGSELPFLRRRIMAPSGTRLNGA